jgi:hypothetical protein
MTVSASLVVYESIAVVRSYAALNGQLINATMLGELRTNLFLEIIDARLPLIICLYVAVKSRDEQLATALLFRR